LTATYTNSKKEIEGRKARKEPGNWNKWVTEGGDSKEMQYVRR